MPDAPPTSPRRQTPLRPAGLFALLGIVVGIAQPAAGQAPERRQADIRHCIVLDGEPTSRRFLRCLVDRYKWDVDTATQLVVDSLQARDARAVGARAAQAAESARVEKAYRAARRREGLTAVVGDRSRKLFFRNDDTCTTQQAISKADRIYFWDRAEAEAAGYTETMAPNCFLKDDQ